MEHGPTNTLILDFWPPDRKRTNLYRVSHAAHGTWLWELQEMNPARKAQGPEVQRYHQSFKLKILFSSVLKHTACK